MVQVAPDNWKEWNPNDPLWTAKIDNSHLPEQKAILNERSYIQGNTLFNTMFGDYLPEENRRQWGNLYQPNFGTQMGFDQNEYRWDNGPTKALEDLYGIAQAQRASNGMLPQSYWDQRFKSLMDPKLGRASALEDLKNKLGYGNVSTEQFARDWVQNYKPGEQLNPIYNSGLPGYAAPQQSEVAGAVPSPSSGVPPYASAPAPQPPQTPQTPAPQPAQPVTPNNFQSNPNSLFGMPSKRNNTGFGVGFNRRQQKQNGFGGGFYSRLKSYLQDNGKL